MIDIVVAMDKNNLIGTDKTPNHLPWHNKEDFQHFRKLTLGKTILMGKNTYEAIGKPLPKRHTIVLSYEMLDNLPENVSCTTDLAGIIEEYRKNGEDLYICGGASVYRAALPLCDRLILSRIFGDYEGNAWFPDFKAMNYVLESVEPKETFQLEIYRRKTTC